MVSLNVQDIDDLIIISKVMQTHAKKISKIFKIKEYSNFKQEFESVATALNQGQDSIQRWKDFLQEHVDTDANDVKVLISGLIRQAEEVKKVFEKHKDSYDKMYGVLEVQRKAWDEIVKCLNKSVVVNKLLIGEQKKYEEIQKIKPKILSIIKENHDKDVAACTKALSEIRITFEAFKTERDKIEDISFEMKKDFETILKHFPSLEYDLRKTMVYWYDLVRKFNDEMSSLTEQITDREKYFKKKEAETWEKLKVTFKTSPDPKDVKKILDDIQNNFLALRNKQDLHRKFNMYWFGEKIKDASSVMQKYIDSIDDQLIKKIRSLEDKLA